MDGIQLQLKQNLNNILDVIKNDLATIRTGRATSALVENVVISAYNGSAQLKIMELATISTHDSQTIVITPFDQTTLGDLERGIKEANLGFNPIVDGNIIRITIPPLTTERREELIKSMKHKIENGKIMIRQARHESLIDLKKLHENKEISDDEHERQEKEIQKVIDNSIGLIESMASKKEEELHQI